MRTCQFLGSTTALLGTLAWTAPAYAQQAATGIDQRASGATSPSQDNPTTPSPGPDANGSTTGAPARSSPAADESKDIVVVGSIRRSLEQAAEIKRNALQVVDSIVAEDIGKFPDPTTAAALQRVPGVQVTVGNDNEIAGVRIRGLTDILSTIDGREVFATTDRNFNLQDLPAQALARVDVIKSSTADLTEGGIAGIIDLKLNKPFNFRRPTIVMTARGDYAENQSRVNPQFAILATDRWNTGIGEIGALVNVSWRRNTFDRPFLYEAVRRSTAAAPFALPGFASQNVAGGVSQNGTFKRPQVNFALQWQASPSLQVYLDGLYTGYEANQQTDFVEAQLFNTGTAISKVVASNRCFDSHVGAAGFNNATAPIQNLCEVTSAVYTNPTAFASTQADKQHRDNYLLGGGLTFDRGPGHIKLDVAYQKSKSVDELFIIDIGKRLPEVDVNSYGPDGGVYTYVGNPLANSTGFVFRNGINQNFQRSNGDLFQARLDGRFRVDGPLKELQFGGRFASRGANYDQALVNKAAPGGDIGQVGGDKGTLISATALPGDFLSLTPGIPGLNDDAPWLSPNPDYLRSSAGRDLLRQIFGLPTGDPAYQTERHFNAREKTLSGYVQAVYDIGIAGPVRIDGALGVRATITDRQISGAGLVSGIAVARTAKTSDTDFLPNASARIRFGGGLQSRLTYAKAIRRPDFGSLNPGLNYVANFNPNVQNSGNAGNPALKEQKSDSYDATLEYFFHRGYIVVGGYYRRIGNRVITSTTLEDIGGVSYNIARPRNVGQVTLKGIEAGGQAFLDFLPGALSGFGVQANFTLADSKIGGGDPLASFPLQGVSKYNFNAGLLYEKFGLSGRLIYNYRSSYIDADSTAGTTIRPIDAAHVFTTVRPAGRLDFGIGYDIDRRIRVDVGGSNVLHNKFRSYFDPPGFNADTRWDDTIYTLGVRVKI